LINKLIEQLLPLIDKDNPERQNDFIVKEGLIDKLKALVNKPEQSPSASKRFKKKSAKLLDEVKELLRQLPKQESLPRAIRQLITEDATPESEYTLALRRIIDQNKLLLVNTKVSGYDVFHKLLLEVKQLQNTMPFESVRYGEHEPLLKFLNDPAFKTTNELIAIDNLKNLYSGVFTRISIDELQIPHGEEHKRRNDRTLTNQSLAQVAEAYRRTQHHEDYIAEETRRIGQFLQQNGFFTTEEYIKLHGDCSRLGLVQCLERNNLHELDYYRMLKLMREARDIIDRPLTRFGYQQIRRLKATWQEGTIQPGEEFERDCTHYLMQCEFLNQVEAQVRMVLEDYPMLIQVCLRIYNEQPNLANYPVLDIDILARKKVKLQRDLLALVQLIARNRLSIGISIPSTLTSEDLNRNVRISSYLKLRDLEMFYRDLTNDHKEWLLREFIPIDNWPIEDSLSDLDFIKKSEKALNAAY